MTRDPKDRRGQIVPLNANSPRNSVGKTQPTCFTLRPPVWLEAWNPRDIVPASAAELRSLLTSYRTALTSPGPIEVASALEPLVRQFEPPKDWEIKAPEYLVALGDIPLPLLQHAVLQCQRYCEFFPRPATIRGHIEHRLREMQDTARRLDTALFYASMAERRKRA